MFSLPFTDPAYFDIVFDRVKKSLKIDGIFCGHLFGIHDAWAKNVAMTFHTEEQVKDLLAGFEIILFQETDADSTLTNGIAKHWHLFTIIAKKIA